MEVDSTHSNPDNGFIFENCGRNDISAQDLIDQLLQQTMANSDDFVDESSDDNEVEEINFNNKDENRIDSCSSDKLNDDEEEKSPKTLHEPSSTKRVRVRSSESENVSKRKKKDFQPPKLQDPGRDIFCWRCHKFGGDVIPCKLCPRVFHFKCSHLQQKTSDWMCTECDAIASAEKDFSRNPLTKGLASDKLKNLLSFVIKRMRHHEGSCHFENLVDPQQYPDYKDYIVNPMYLKLLEKNVECSRYSNCEAFLSDAKWMVHNSYIFNTAHSELTIYARAMIKHAKHECEEILNCPNCYLHANTLEDDAWFIEPCDIPHILVWARLKGWPFWPCKVMKISGSNVDVRFFGDHNKSVVPVEQCFLYSKQMPSKQKKFADLEVAISEAFDHIEKLEERFGEFRYAPGRTVLNPKEEFQQRKLLLPHFHEGMTPEEAAEIRSKVQKKDCKITIVMSGLMQRSATRNNTPAVVSINRKKGESTQVVDISAPTDKTNGQQLHPILTERLLHKSSPQPSSSSILIEDDDSNENDPERTSCIEKVADNSKQNLSANEPSSSSVTAKLHPVSNISKTYSKGHFLSQFNLTRNPQSSNVNSSMKIPFGKKTFNNVLVLPSKEHQNSLGIQREKKAHVYFPLKIGSNISKLHFQKEPFSINRKILSFNKPKLRTVEHQSYSFERKTGPELERPSTSSTIDSMRIDSKDLSKSETTECESNRRSINILRKQAHHKNKIMEPKHLTPDYKQNDLDALAKKCTNQTFRPMVVIEKLKEDMIVKHLGIKGLPQEKKVEDISKPTNDISYNFNRLDEDISHLLPQMDTNEEDYLSDGNLSPTGSLSECASPVAEISSNEELVPLLIKAYGSTSMESKTTKNNSRNDVTNYETKTNQTTCTAIDGSSSKSNFINSSEHSSVSKLQISQTGAKQPNPEKTLWKLTASQSKNAQCDLMTSLKKQSPMICIAQNQKILLHTNNLPKILTSSVNQSHTTSNLKKNNSEIYENSSIIRKSNNNDNISNLYSNNSCRFTLLGKRCISPSEAEKNYMDAVKDQAQPIKKKHIFSFSKYNKLQNLDRNHTKELLSGTVGCQVSNLQTNSSVGSGNNIRTDVEFVPSPSENSKKRDKKPTNCRFLFFKNKSCSSQSRERNKACIEEISENERSITIQFDSLGQSDSSQETINKCSETDDPISLFGRSVGKVNYQMIMRKNCLEQINVKRYLAEGYPIDLPSGKATTYKLESESQDIKHEIELDISDKDRSNDWVVNSLLPEESIYVCNENEQMNNGKVEMNSNISNNTNESNMILQDVDITDLSVNKNDSVQTNITNVDVITNERCNTSGLIENELDDLCQESSRVDSHGFVDLIECGERNPVSCNNKTVPQQLGHKNKMSTLHCHSRDLNVNGSTKSSDKLSKNEIHETDNKLTEGRGFGETSRKSSESESQVVLKQKSDPKICASVSTELEKSGVCVEKVCTLETLLNVTNSNEPHRDSLKELEKENVCVKKVFNLDTCLKTTSGNETESSLPLIAELKKDDVCGKKVCNLDTSSKMISGSETESSSPILIELDRDCAHDKEVSNLDTLSNMTSTESESSVVPSSKLVDDLGQQMDRAILPGTSKENEQVEQRESCMSEVFENKNEELKKKTKGSFGLTSTITKSGPLLKMPNSKEGFTEILVEEMSSEMIHENEAKVQDITSKKIDNNKVLFLELHSCKSHNQNEDEEHERESDTDSFSDENAANYINTCEKVSPKFVQGDNVSESSNKISSDIENNKQDSLVISDDKNIQINKTLPSKEVDGSSEPDCTSLLPKNHPEDKIIFKGTDSPQCLNIPSLVVSEDNGSKNYKIESSNKVQEVQNTYSSYKVLRKKFKMNAKKRRGNLRPGGKPSINLRNYAMYFEEMEEFVKAFEKAIPESANSNCLRRKFKEVEEKILKKIENERREYLEEIDSTFTLEKELYKQDSQELWTDEMKMMIEEIKKKQWCVLCLNEAKFHCCWSTSYCSEKCQLADWPTHSKSCTQYKMNPKDPDLSLSPIFRSLLKRMKDKKLEMKDLVEEMGYLVEVENEDRDGCTSLENNTEITMSENSSERQNSPLTTSDKAETIVSSLNSSCERSKSPFYNSNLEPISNAAGTSSSVPFKKNPVKTIIHVSKENPLPRAKVQLIKKSSEADSLTKPLMVAIKNPNPNSGQTLVSIGQAIPPRSLSKFTLAGGCNPQKLLMGKNKFILPKNISPPARIIGALSSRQEESEGNVLSPSPEGNVIISLPKSSSSLQIGSRTLNIPASKEKAFLVIEKNSFPSVQYATKASESSQMSVPSGSSKQSSFSKHCS